MKNAVLKRFVFITLITLVVSTLVCLWLVGDYNLNQTKASMIDAVKLIDSHSYFRHRGGERAAVAHLQARPRYRAHRRKG